MYSARKDMVSVNCHLPQTNCFIIIFINVALEMLVRWKNRRSLFSPPPSFLFLSDSAVSAHAPSSALQEIRKEKRLTAQFHKTPPRHHFIFSEPFFFFPSLSFIYFIVFWKTNRAITAVPSQVIYPPCRVCSSTLTLRSFNPELISRCTGRMSAHQKRRVVLCSR